MIETPGHSPDHLVFLEDRYRTAIVGDLLSALSTVVIDPPDGHLRTYLESLERLKAHDPEMIVPGHGPPTRGGSALIDRVLEHRASRERKLIDALGNEARDDEDILRRTYDDVAEELWPLARLSLAAGLLKLEEDGIAVREGDGWRCTSD